MKKRWMFGVIVGVLAAGLLSQLPAETPDEAAKRVREQIKQLREGPNAGAILAEAAGEKFNSSKGVEKSCSACHGKGGTKLKGAFTKMPRYYKDIDMVADLDLRIKKCSEKYQGKKVKGKKARKSLVHMAMFVASLSNGMKLDPMPYAKMNAKEKAVFDKGKRLWEMRAGTRDFSCRMCHDKYAGKRIRLQGLLDLKKSMSMRYWPAFRFGKDKGWTAEDRIRGCYKQMRFKPKPPHYSKTVIGLQMYMFHLSKGGVVAAPGLVR